MIQMPDTVIYRFNMLGKYQQEILVFTDYRFQIIGDGDVYIKGVDGNGDENQAPLKIGNENYFDYQEDQEEFHPDQEDQTIQQPIKV